MDPNYMHEHDPNRNGLCKRIVSGKICHQGPEALVHTRFENRRQEAAAEASTNPMVPVPVCPKCGYSNIRIEWMYGKIYWIKCQGIDSGEACGTTASCEEEYAKFFPTIEN